MRIKTARIGDTLFVYDETTEASVKQANIVADGHAANYDNGTSEWIVDEPIVDTTKVGSAMFVWDKAGTRIKHERCRYIKDKNGNVTRKVEKTVYKVF